MWSRKPYCVLRVTLPRPGYVFLESIPRPSYVLLGTLARPSYVLLETLTRPGYVLLGNLTRPSSALLEAFLHECGSMRCFQLEWSVSGTKAENSGGSRSPDSLLSLHRLLKPITLTGEYHDVGVMHQTVYQSRCQAVIAQHRIPTGEL